MASSVDVLQISEQELEYELDKQGLPSIPDKVLVYSIEGPFFFGAAEKFERALAQTHTDPRILIIRMQRVPFIDITGLLTLEEVTQKLARRNIKTFLCEANSRVKGKLIKAEILTQTSGVHYFDKFTDAIAYSRTLEEQLSPE